MKLMPIILTIFYFVSSAYSICDLQERIDILKCYFLNLTELEGILKKDTIEVLLCDIAVLSNNAFPFSNLRKLDITQCRINKLSQNSFANLTKIQELDLSYNELTAVPNDLFKDLKILNKLKITNNKLANPRVDSFSGLNNLLSLDISYNRITFIPLGALDGMTKVESLNLSKNALLELPESLFRQNKHLQHIDLSNNLLTNLNLGLADEFLNVLTLNLSGNRLTELTLHAGISFSWHKLIHLDISRNKIRSIEYPTFQNLHSLSVLKINNNEICNVLNGMLEDLNKLIYLDLSYNKISTVAPGSFLSNYKMKFLNLSHNSINVLPTKIFNVNIATNLEIIDLSFNNLETIQKDLFNLYMLKKVFVNNNKITILDVDAFSNGYSEITEVNVRFNRLVYIELGLLQKLVHLKKFEIGGNPWHCPCLKILLNALVERFVEFSKEQDFDGRRPSCIAIEPKICENKVINTTEFEEFIKKYI